MAWNPLVITDISTVPSILWNKRKKIKQLENIKCWDTEIQWLKTNRIIQNKLPKMFFSQSHESELTIRYLESCGVKCRLHVWIL